MNTSTFFQLFPTARCECWHIKTVTYVTHFWLKARCIVCISLLFRIFWIPYIPLMWSATEFIDNRILSWDIMDSSSLHFPRNFLSKYSLCKNYWNEILANFRLNISNHVQYFRQFHLSKYLMYTHDFKKWIYIRQYHTNLKKTTNDGKTNESIVLV